MKKHFNKNLIMSENIYFNKVRVAGFVKNLLIMMKKKLEIMQNGLEKYIAFFLNKNLVFIGSMQFMNSSLEKPVKNLSDEDFKYLVEEFGSKNLELLKQKGDHPYEYINSFERFNEEKLSARKYFYSSIKDGKIGDDGEVSDGHISVKDYLKNLG